ncbi:MAG: GH92 family glycosyl hydrolase [Bacteroidaceae bacterium]|nr:GH92 family glycosyl hydrolase [Bacteroidaceae bacterium]
MKLFKTGLFVFALSAAASAAAEKQVVLSPTSNLISFVNPMIGTDGYGNVFPGAQLPFGGIQMSPDTDEHFYDAAAGYKYNKESIEGFSLTHFSGTGIPDLGDFLFVPGTGAAKLDQGDEKKPNSGYRSRFSHQTEKASVNYYAVTLEDYKVRAEMTTALRSGMFRFTYPQSDKSFVLIDMQHTLWFNCIWANLRVLNDSTVVGSKLVAGWGPEREVYFAAVFSKKLRDITLYKEGKPIIYNTYRFRSPLEICGRDLRFLLNFQTGENEQLMVRTAVSGVSTEGALLNLKETEGKTFDQIQKEGEQVWEKELSRYHATGTRAQLESFYTSAYHTVLCPFLFSDADGSYRGLDKNIHHENGFHNLTVFSTWDTFRALHPLYNLVHQDVQADVANSFLAHQEQSVEHLLPIWAFYGNETWCMIGYHSCSILADMIVKNVSGFDRERAFRAMLATANSPRYDGVADYDKLGFVPFDHESESVSKTLEYAYDDYAIAQAAKALGKDAEYQHFMNRALSYQNIYDTTTGYMRAKNKDGNWRTPFHPNEYEDPNQNGWPDITEGTSVQYSWYVPQDVQGLRTMMGEKLFKVRLDSLFGGDKTTASDRAHDIEGRIGDYWHGNEPCHQIAYYFNYAGEPWKCQKWVRFIVDNFYGNKPGSLCGNDDCGQMSAWYIFNCLGFYPIAPTSGYYNLGSPALPALTLSLSNGKTLKMTTKNWSKKNVYVHKFYLNGKVWDKSYIPYEAIRDGATLLYEMSDKPNMKRAVAPDATAPSISEYGRLVKYQRP